MQNGGGRERVNKLRDYESKGVGTCVLAVSYSAAGLNSFVLGDWKVRESQKTTRSNGFLRCYPPPGTSPNFNYCSGV